MGEVVALDVVGACVLGVQSTVFCEREQVAARCREADPLDDPGVGYELGEVIADGQIAEPDVGALLDEGGAGQAEIVEAIIIVDEGARLPCDGQLLVEIFGCSALAACSACGAVQPLFCDVVDTVPLYPVELEGEGDRKSTRLNSSHSQIS